MILFLPRLLPVAHAQSSGGAELRTRYLWNRELKFMLSAVKESAPF